MSLINPNHTNDSLDFLWNLFTDGGKELFTTKSYGLCFVDKGWRTINGHRLERRHFNDHFLGYGKGDIGVKIPWRSRWFRIDIDNHRRGPKKDQQFLTKIVTLYDQLLKYGAPAIDGIPAIWSLEVKRTLTGAHFDFFFHRPLFTALKFKPIYGRTKGAEMECGNELLRNFLEVTDLIFQTNVFASLELPVSKKNCRLPFGRDYQLILNDVYDKNGHDCFVEWIREHNGHLSTKDLFGNSCLNDISQTAPSNLHALTNKLPHAAKTESGENIYMSSTELNGVPSALQNCIEIKEDNALKKAPTSKGLWNYITSFWKGELPKKQYEGEYGGEGLQRALCETYKILRFERDDYSECVTILEDLLKGLPENCRRNSIFKEMPSEQRNEIENIIEQTEKWLAKHPEAVHNLEISYRRFASKGRLIHRKETWNKEPAFLDNYSSYQLRRLSPDIIEEISNFQYWTGSTCRYLPEGLIDKIPELVSFLCNVARKRGGKSQPTGLELVMLLVGREFGVGLHKSLASKLVNYLLRKDYLVLLKDYVKKVHGRTLGIGETFKGLPFK